VNIHGAHSYWKQGALGAAGQACMYGLELGRSVRRTRAGAYRGGRPPTACFHQCFDAVVSLITGNASGLLKTSHQQSPRRHL